MTDIHSFDPAWEGIRPLIEKVWGYCDANDISAKTVTLKVKYANFTQITRSKTTAMPFGSFFDLEDTVKSLLEAIFPVSRGIRLLGVTLSSLERKSAEREPPQLLLFT
ncbi:DNA polymerase Y-family domain-containing protein [Rhizobium etli bv. mimosae str. IE4771]|uniref:DNA polymerase Y-family domain-containing protein n=1 Tax=Rhizobium etli bv. mimosae str. IE4771 TaxID=1432050 RepID=A0A060I850_RHIET|nr:DNA polymerase Y-family domain-containing protein [Rhizobium sp. IE4771]